MKILKLRQVIASTLVVASIIALNPIIANAEWRQDNRGWWFTEGNSWARGWRNIAGKWYYFDNNGYMLHDTTTPDGYKVGSDGVWIQNNVENASNGAVNNNIQDNNMNLQNQAQPQQQQAPPK